MSALRLRAGLADGCRRSAGAGPGRGADGARARRPGRRGRRLRARPAAGAALEGPRPRGLRRAARRPAGAARRDRTRGAGGPRLPGLQARPDRRGPAPPRVEARPRPHGLHGGGRSRPCRSRTPPGAATSPSTPSAGIRSPTSTSTRSAAAPTSTRAGCAWSTRALSPTTACACCARCSSPPASHARSMTRPRAICRAIPLDDLPAERLWGEFEKLLLVARTAVARLHPGARARGDRADAARDGAALRLPAGSGVASRGRCLDRTR